jgi:hypothetical protein
VAGEPLAELTDRHCGSHDYTARALGAWIQQMLDEIGLEPPGPERPHRGARRGLEVLDGGRV